MPWMSGRKSFLDCPWEGMLTLDFISRSLISYSSCSSGSDTHVLPGQSHRHRQRSRTYHDHGSFAMTPTNCSIDSSFADVHTAFASQAQANQPFAPGVRVLLSSGDTHSLPEVPKRSSTLVCFASVGRSIHPGILSSQESQDGRFLLESAIEDIPVRTILVDICCPISG